MPISYTSVFDGSATINRSELCEILNLDRSRPSLNFTPAEIHAAYRRRAFLFHPDKKSKHHLPEEVCNILMNEILLARDYLLQGKESIPGKTSLEGESAWSYEKIRENVLQGKDWVDMAIDLINGLENENLIQLTADINLFSSVSNGFLMAVVLSLFNKEGFLILSTLSNLPAEGLKRFQGNFQNIEPEKFTQILQKIKELLKKEFTFSIAEVREQLRLISPALGAHAHFEEFITAIQTMKNQLKVILTDDLIRRAKGMASFWPNFVANFPSWKNIIGVYFFALVFTCNSVPKFFSTVETIIAIIRKHKGTPPLLIALPMLVFTPLLYPLNIVFQLSRQCVELALKTIFQIAKSIFNFSKAVINLLQCALSPHKSCSQPLFNLLKSIFDLTVRLSFNLITQTLGALFFLLSNQDIMSPLEKKANHFFESLCAHFFPKKDWKISNAKAKKTKTSSGYATAGSSFFANESNSSSDNEEDNDWGEDRWLNEVLRRFAQNDDLAPLPREPQIISL